MACDLIHAWTFCSLVGAFLDLFLAYLILCGSAAAYFIAKFLGIFRLSLPCPCNGFFGDPSSKSECRCLQRVLIDFPAQRISSVQLSVQRRFPFDKVWLNGDAKTCVKLLGDQIHDGFTETHSVDHYGRMESICSYSEVQRVDNLERSEHSSSAQSSEKLTLQRQNGGKLEPNAKADWYQKSKSGLRRRRKFVPECGRSLTATPEAHFKLGGKETCDSEHGRESSVESFPGKHSHNDRLEHSVESPHGEEWVEPVLSNSDSKGAFRDKRFDGNGLISIKDLEEALKEEHAARSALYLELDKERSAAASAADEAMAMISRLQEEKAAMEMDSRQYHRMVVEKVAYDAEEMNILKEILLRHEREKLVLEKEIEAYKEMFVNRKSYLSEEEGQYDKECVLDQEGVVASFDMNDDPIFLLQEISASLEKKKLSKDMKSVPNTEFGALLEAESNFKQLIENARHESFARLRDGCGSSNQSLCSTDNHLCRTESDGIQSPSAQAPMEKIETHNEQTLLVSPTISAARLMDTCPSSNQDSPSYNFYGIKNHHELSQAEEVMTEKIEIQLGKETILPPLHEASLMDICGSPDKASSVCRVESNIKQSQSSEGSTENNEMQCEDKTVLSAADMKSHSSPRTLQDSNMLNQFNLSLENLQQCSSFHSGSKRKENKGANVICDSMCEKDRSSCGSKKDKNTWYSLDQPGNHANNSKNCQIGPQPGIYDVHVVDDNILFGNAGFGQRSGILSAKAIARNSLVAFPLELFPVPF